MVGFILFVLVMGVAGRAWGPPELDAKKVDKGTAMLIVAAWVAFWSLVFFVGLSPEQARPIFCFPFKPAF
jgi:hypothetical protein